MKSNFHFYVLKLFSSKSVGSELSNALSIVILSGKLMEIRSFKVMFRNAGRVLILTTLKNSGKRYSCSYAVIKKFEASGD